MIKAIIFDCFGVLVGKGFDNTYRKAGGDPAHDRTFIEKTLNKAHLGLISEREFQRQMAKQLKISSGDWNRSMRVAEQLNTELLACVKELHTSYKTAILSNANREVMDHLIGKNLLQKDFDEVIVSAELGIAKPDQHIYQVVIDRLNVKFNECLYIDNRQSFLDVAEQLGMRVFLYVGFSDFQKNLNSLLAK
jgi:HAD superfamily hydrolase (TIGR01509 family)